MKLLSRTLVLFCIIGNFLYGQTSESNLRELALRQIDALMSQMTLKEKVSQLLNESPAIERLNIPAYNWWSEALHGVARLGRATVFPQPIALAATFDDLLIKQMAAAIATEARAKYAAAQRIGNKKMRYSGLTFWSPNINIFRDPRWGRGMETFGEDPLLTSRMGVAFIKGLQGDHPFFLKAAACAKHFAVHSGPEGLRHEFNAQPSDFDLYNTYLPAFRAAVMEGKVAGVMCAYNRLFGSPCCGNTFLLTDLLRKDWGFDGYIVSDCGAIHDFFNGHKVVSNVVEAAAQALKAGVNLNCGYSFKYLDQAVEQGLITEDQIDQRLRELYLIRFRLGILGNLPGNPYGFPDSSVVECEAHRQLAYQAALKSMVLLKNNGVLPLKRTLKDLLVVGPTAADMDALLGNYYGLAGQMVTFVEGISQKVSLGTRLEYRRAFRLDVMNKIGLGWGINEAQAAEVTIVVMGLNNLLEGEEGEAIASPFKSDRSSLELPENQLFYLRKIAENRTNPLIVVLTAGSPIQIEEVLQLADAVILAWYPGQEGGRALADLIFGDAVPSGRLPITFPASMEQLPPYEDYSMQGRTYRYMTGEPLFPFGFGLSYTTFDYLDLKLQNTEFENSKSVEITAAVKNTGKRDAEEVVQVYIKNESGNHTLPKLWLADFKRVFIKAGQMAEIKFSLPLSAFSYWDEAGQRAYQPGPYSILVAGASPVRKMKALGLDDPLEVKVKLTADKRIVKF